MKRYIRKGISRVRTGERAAQAPGARAALMCSIQAIEKKENIAHEAIDRAKNLETVLAFMALKQKSPALCSKVRVLITENT